MSSPILDLADAIVTLLNAQTLSLSFTAARTYVPKFDTANASSVQVKVVPASDSRGPQGTAHDGATMVIDVGVMKRLQNSLATETTEIDAAMAFVEEIRGVLNRVRPSVSIDAICTEISQSPIYDVTEVDERRVFLTVLSATYYEAVAT